MKEEKFLWGRAKMKRKLKLRRSVSSWRCETSTTDSTGTKINLIAGDN